MPLISGVSTQNMTTRLTKTDKENISSRAFKIAICFFFSKLNLAETSKLFSGVKSGVKHVTPPPA
jgi:hypothetical protein